MKKNILTRAARHIARAASTALVALAMSHTACTEEIDAPGRNPGGTPLHIVASVATTHSAAEPARAASTELARAASTAASTTGDQLRISYNSPDNENLYGLPVTYTATVSSEGTVNWTSIIPICWEDLGTKGDAAATTRFLLEAYGNGRFTHTAADGNANVTNTATPARNQSTLDAYLAADYIKVEGVKLSKVNPGAELDKDNQQLVAEMTHQHTDVVAQFTVAPTHPGMSSSVVLTKVELKDKSGGANYIPYIATAASTAASTTSEYCAILPAAAVPLPGTGDASAILAVTYTKEGGAEQTVNIAYTLTGSDAGNAPADPADTGAWAAYFAGKRLNLALTLTDSKMSATATLTPWTERMGEVEMVPATSMEIKDAATLKRFANRVSGGETTLNAIVKADFTYTLIGDERLPMIGSNGNAFDGIFDGGEHTITLDTRNSTSGAATDCLFANIGTSGTVKNLTVEGIDPTNWVTVSNSAGTGGIALGNSGTVQNCHVRYLNIIASMGAVGGITASNTGTITACSVTQCHLSGGGNSGGIVANNTGTVQNSYAADNTFGTNGTRGLLVGNNDATATVQHCAYITGTLNAIGTNSGSDSNNIGYLSATALNAGAPATLNPGMPTIIGADGKEKIWVAGTGTPAYPALGEKPTNTNDHMYIYNETDLRAFAKLVNGATKANDPVLKTKATVMCNFTLTVGSGNKAWGGIGIGKAYFGTFDGQGCTITLIATTGTPATQGLFGSLGEGAVVKNLTLQGSGNDKRAYINSSSANVGCIVGTNSGIVQNCHVRYLSVATSSNNNACTGGIVGYNSGSGTITACSVAASSMAGTHGGGFAGGIVGYNSGTVQNSYAVGSTLNNAYKGLLVGWNNSSSGATVKNCAYITGDNGAGGTNGNINPIAGDGPGGTGTPGIGGSTTGSGSASAFNADAPAKLNNKLSIGYQWASGTAANGAYHDGSNYYPVTVAVTTKK